MIHWIRAFYGTPEFYRRLACVVGIMMGAVTLLITITERDIDLSCFFGSYAMAFLCLGIFGSERLIRLLLIPGAIMSPIFVGIVLGSAYMRTQTVPLVLSGLIATVVLNTLVHGVAVEKRWAFSALESGALLVSCLCLTTVMLLVLIPEDRSSAIIGVPVNLFWAVVFFLAARSLRRKRLLTLSSPTMNEEHHARESR